jgi:hypothetical protein
MSEPTDIAKAGTNITDPQPSGKKARKKVKKSTSTKPQWSDAQRAWLTNRLPSFLEAQRFKTVGDFWPMITREYYVSFPEDGMRAGSALNEEESSALSKRLKELNQVSLLVFSLELFLSIC